MHSIEAKSKAERLLIAGETIDVVAKKVFVSFQTVGGWRAKLARQGLVPKRKKGLKSKTYWKNKG